MRFKLVPWRVMSIVLLALLLVPVEPTFAQEAGATINIDTPLDGQTFTAGQLYEEPIGTPMQARNISGSEQLKVLLFQVHGHGEPLAYKAE